MSHTPLPPYTTPLQRVGHWTFLLGCAAIFLFLIAPVLVVMPLAFNQDPYFNFPIHTWSLRWFDDVALTVIMATRGYPGDYGKGSVIEGLDQAAKVEGVEIFHAGTVAKDGKILANGGRVLNICAMGRTVSEARARAYQAVDLIRWPDGFCRRDIGWRAVAREQV